MRIFRYFAINDINIGPISSASISNRAFLWGFLVNTLIII